MGAFGGVLLMRFTDKRGAIAITIMPFITASSGAYTGACSTARHLLRRISQCQAFYTHRERHSDETYKSSFHARACFDSAVAKTASLDSKHRSNPASGANDSRQGPVEGQRSQVCRKPPRQKIFCERRA